MLPTDVPKEAKWSHFSAGVLEGEGGVLSAMKAASAGLLLFDACRTELNTGHFQGEDLRDIPEQVLSCFSCGLGARASDKSPFAAVIREVSSRACRVIYKIMYVCIYIYIYIILYIHI
jgi:hypothetical protein